mmetsp:Transcript_71008/g.199331  ORF Transcript_71008/g.199331 Transcript_71008/m.199331 type:complete len:218 (-) Transcript_71008:199-852(-)
MVLPEPIDGPRAPEPSIVAKNQGRIVVVAESKGEVEWVEVYDWKTGCCYFMQEDTGERVYPDGGPGAIFEETKIDGSVHKDVGLGPGFKVVDDRDLDFIEMWGHSWPDCCHKGRSRSPNRFDPRKGARKSGGAGGMGSGVGGSADAGGTGEAAGWAPGEFERLVERATETPDVWVMVAMAAAACFTWFTATDKPYQALTSLGFVAGLFCYRHITFKP